jgi:hypothetical protein
MEKILSISGRRGLFKLISQGKNVVIVESLIDQKRIPIYPKEKIVPLENINILTDGEEVPLPRIFSIIKEKENGKPIIYDPEIKPDELKNYFAEIVPNFDRDKVYTTDIKKIMNWYNILINGWNEYFEQEEKGEQESEKTEEQKPPQKEESI